MLPGNRRRAFLQHASCASAKCGLFRGKKVEGVDPFKLCCILEELVEQEFVTGAIDDKYAVIWFAELGNLRKYLQIATPPDRHFGCADRILDGAHLGQREIDIMALQEFGRVIGAQTLDDGDVGLVQPGVERLNFTHELWKPFGEMGLSILCCGCHHGIKIHAR